MLRVTAIALLVVAAFAAAAPVYAAVGACDPHACGKKAQATRLVDANADCCPPAACVQSTTTANQPNRQLETVPQRQVTKLAAITPSAVVLVTSAARPAVDSGIAAPPPSSRARLAQLATLLI